MTHGTADEDNWRMIIGGFPLVTDLIAVALNNCAIDRLHKDRCTQAFGEIP